MATIQRDAETLTQTKHKTQKWQHNNNDKKGRFYNKNVSEKMKQSRQQPKLQWQPFKETQKHLQTKHKLLQKIQKTAFYNERLSKLFD